jgi:hypothetical protein
MPRPAVDSRRSHDPSNLNPLAIHLPVREIAEPMNLAQGQGRFAQYAHALFPDHRCKFSGASCTLQFYKVAQMVFEWVGVTALYKDTRSRVLNKEVR